MSAGKGDKPRPVDKARYDVNFTAINWKSRSGGKSVENCARSSTSKRLADAAKNLQSDADDLACRRTG